MVRYFRRRMRRKYTLAVVCCVGIIFILFQMKWVQELTNKAFSYVPPVRGVHFKLARFYFADENNKFTCLIDRELIDFDKVNDDYCDCEDGTDEPGTSACPNGFFCCESDTYKRTIVSLPSGRVNDGICDCCDGSDEWQITSFPSAVPDHVQRRLGSSQAPCPNIC